jgi:hypothetical protein
MFRKWSVRLSWMIGGVAALYAASSLAGVVSGGSLDPPGAPAPTMLRLDELPPSWHRALDASAGCPSPRFECVMGGAAALDRETGIVWQQDSLVNPDSITWFAALAHCRTATTGGRTGWRAPTVEEFLSLFDVAFTQPAVPPFAGVSIRYWTSSTDPEDTANAFYYSFSASSLFSAAKNISPATATTVWCVRAPTAVDGM